MRAHYKRVGRLMDKSCAESSKAAYYKRKAAGVGKAGISSDDPEAVVKLKEKLAGMERGQKFMKKANKIVKSKPKNKETPEKIKALMALGINLAKAEGMFVPDFCGRFGFPSYALQNNNANMRRIRQRIEQLQQAPAETKTTKHGEVEVVENVEENRLQLVFPGKPPEKVRRILKSYGFRWSPRNVAWQRHLNGNGRYAAKSVLEQIDKLAS